jgi:hypothetical protein
LSVVAVGDDVGVGAREAELINPRTKKKQRSAMNPTMLYESSCCQRILVQFVTHKLYGVKIEFRRYDPEDKEEKADRACL